MELENFPKLILIQAGFRLAAEKFLYNRVYLNVLISFIGEKVVTRNEYQPNTRIKTMHKWLAYTLKVESYLVFLLIRSSICLNIRHQLNDISIPITPFLT